jgi:RNA-directed DNA polymerase
MGPSLDLRTVGCPSHRDVFYQARVEADSYRFRPGREHHQALDEVARVICTRLTGWILELDITAYFDSIVRTQLMEMLEKRVRDRSALRSIRKWIQVGVIEDGRLLVSETGTGQGQTIRLLLANIYL